MSCLKSALLYPNKFPRLLLSGFVTQFCRRKFKLEGRMLFSNLIGGKNQNVCIRVAPGLGKKDIAICVQSNICSAIC